MFDVDGTLYRQRPLRLRMARDLLFHTVSKLDLNTILVLANYRHIREALADKQVADFEHILIAETASATANALEAVRAIVSEWVEQRPLSYLADCLYPGYPTVCWLAPRRQNNWHTIGLSRGSET